MECVLMIASVFENVKDIVEKEEMLAPSIVFIPNLFISHFRFAKGVLNAKQSFLDFISTGMKHVKGILLYGPPGTGKTLMAR